MSIFETKVKKAYYKHNMLEKEAREDIKTLCTALVKKIEDEAECTDVAKEIRAHISALEIYADILEESSQEYEEAITNLCEAKWKEDEAV